ncbi:SDR family oxidoreductase [Nocardioides terrisoli]|uniref:SDR family oxidoreductase n=1 Tax=Nocardioides terrisoli TaxID=3388267 RepID=UPI00287BC5BA|nr:SDR family oxidoreductase [Nocardioides marmorisolisilvae]
MTLIEDLREKSPFASGLMNGHVAMVTGGASGLGRGIATALALAGATVAVAGRNTQTLAAFAAEMRREGCAIKTVTCDVRDPEAIVAAVDTAEGSLGTLDLLVNNAGATFSVPAEDLTPNGFRAVVETDAFGTFFMCQAFAKRLFIAGKAGAILNITSTSPITGNPGRVHGGVGKAGVDSLTKSLAVEWGPRGIRVNALAPGYTPTQGVDTATRMGTDRIGHLARVAQSVPLRRVGTIADIAWTSVFLLSPAASFITGASLTVDGGKWLSSGRYFDASGATPAAN